MDDKVKECEYQNICVNFNDNLYSKCPIFGWGNKCCYAILYKQNLALKEENARMAKGYELLTDFISTRMLDDFTGYDEVAQSFDIVKAIKEVIEYQEKEIADYNNNGGFWGRSCSRLSTENTTLKQKLKLAVEALENTQDTLVVAFVGNVSDCDYLDRIDGQWAINNEALTKIGEVE